MSRFKIAFGHAFRSSDSRGMPLAERYRWPVTPGFLLRQTFLRFVVIPAALLTLSACHGRPLDAQVEGAFEELRRFSAPEARQAVAVDDRHFYAITNRRIGKYEKDTGARVAEWEASATGSFIHLNSGVVLDGCRPMSKNR